MKKLFVFLFLIACTEKETDPLITHRCTSEQMKKVESETSYCSDKTGYYATHCYKSAIIRNCVKAKGGADE